MFVVNAPLPVVPEDATLRVEKCPVIEAPSVDKRSWPGVRARGEEYEDSSTACDCFVSQGGSEAGGKDVGEKTEVPETTESVE